MHIIIDPGHGGNDKGGSHQKIYEKHLALETSLRLKEFLRRRGYRVILTRDRDQFLSLQRRVDIANTYPEALFVSIHYNSYSSAKVKGIETFYTSSKSRNMARYIQKEILRKLPYSLHRRVRKADFFVTRYTRHPAVLVECGFISNPQERSAMKGAKYRQDIAEGIGKGLIRYHKYYLRNQD